MTLSTRAEQAAPEEARGLLEELAAAVWGHDYDECVVKDGDQFELFCRFDDLLDAEAFVDAAMMLMPEGWGWALMPHYAELRHPERRAKDCVCHGATPALALIAAIAKAQEAGQ